MDSKLRITLGWAVMDWWLAQTGQAVAGKQGTGAWCRTESGRSDLTERRIKKYDFVSPSACEQNMLLFIRYFTKFTPLIKHSTKTNAIIYLFNFEIIYKRNGSGSGLTLSKSS